MAVRHTAALFSAERYVAVLRADYGLTDSLDLEKMKTDCAARVPGLSTFGTELLSVLRYDPEWFKENEDDPELWGLIRLAELARPAPSLSASNDTGFYFLEQALSAIGWRKDETEHLQKGRSITELFQSPVNADAFPFPNMAYFLAGWLSAEDCKALRRDLLAAWNDEGSPPVAMVSRTEKFATQLNVDAAETLRLVFRDAVAMLDASIASGEALFLTLD
ncbi:hypothetical protein [Nisaea sp.]|uniref:hypothetical protein n=1 Tax=Nisaea sp. TaxID=2024842 RepID=UPI002B26EEE6|nr:hypothetical protein [Nisaea sp.]